MLIFTLLVGFLATLVACNLPDVDRLVELTESLPDRIIRVGNADLSAIAQYPRDHFTLIVLTSTVESHGCESCIDLERILPRVTKPWFRDYGDSNFLFFAVIDIADPTNKPIFDKLKLKKVPQVWLVPPSKTADEHRPRLLPVDKDNNPVFGDFDIFFEPHADFNVPAAKLDDQVFRFADWLGKSVQKRIVFKDDYQMLWFVLYFCFTFGSIIMIKRRGPSKVRLSVDKKKIYMVLTFIVLLAILGGYSFTTINGIPFLAQNDKGEPIYISGGIHWQFGDEIVLVAGHYFLLGLTLVLMTFLGKLPVGSGRLFRDQTQKGLCVLVLNAVLYLLYSSLTSMFQRKDHGYPYHFLHLF